MIDEATLRAAPQVPLRRAYLCPGCDTISTVSEQCPACGSLTVESLFERVQPIHPPTETR